MRKIRIDKETQLTKEVVKWIIEKHSEEKNRIAELRNYYNNKNVIMNRQYKDANKPQNRLLTHLLHISLIWQQGTSWEIQ